MTQIVHLHPEDGAEVVCGKDLLPMHALSAVQHGKLARNGVQNRQENENAIRNGMQNMQQCSESTSSKG